MCRSIDPILCLYVGHKSRKTAEYNIGVEIHWRVAVQDTIFVVSITFKSCL
jgi:hypothetical protein